VKDDIVECTVSQEKKETFTKLSTMALQG